MRLSVFCICAEWCGTCREFLPKFQRLAEQEADQDFVWLDVEANEHLLFEFEIENFPTIIIANEGNICFSGPIPPHPDILQRLCAAAKTGDLKPRHAEPLKALVQQLRS